MLGLSILERFISFLTIFTRIRSWALAEYSPTDEEIEFTDKFIMLILFFSYTKLIYQDHHF